jgi:hypothetical protein
MTTNGKGNGVLNGAPHDEDDGEGEAGAQVGEGEAPANVAELAAACARFVHAKYKVPLDGTSDTLSLLDQYVRDGRGEIAVRPEAGELLTASVGAYLGEVMRRVFGATWFAVGDHDGWRLDMKHVYLTFNPLGMAREALLLEPADGWHAHLETDEAEKDLLEQRLAALPEVPTDEFYLPSTRFDVVELAVEALRAKMIADGHGDVTFGPEDYRRR